MPKLAHKREPVPNNSPFQHHLFSTFNNLLIVVSSNNLANGTPLTFVALTIGTVFHDRLVLTLISLIETPKASAINV